MRQNWTDLIDRLSRGTFLVVGDLILDHHVWGEVDRISPEAPVPVFDSRGEEYTPGGAANVACKIAELGGKVHMAGIVGSDDAALRLKKEVEAFGVDCTDVVEDGERPTATKTRYIARGQQLLRVDREKRHELGSATEQELVRRIAARLSECDGVAIIDYHKGALTDRVLKAALSRSEKIPVVVDPRGDDYSRYAGAWVITPNHRELEIAAKCAIRTDDEFAAAGKQLLTTSKARAIAMKRGGEGITLATAGSSEHFATVPQEVYDVTGAGDAVSSVYLVALAGGMEFAEATDLANLAGGAIVRQIGVGRISREEMTRAAARIAGGGSSSGKVVALEQAAAAVERMKASGRKVVFTNGCFDLIHPGHVYLLEECRKRGDFLVVGINSDESIKRIKGPSRPILLEAERAEVIAAFSSVDAVVIFDEDTPRHLIETIRPDILAKGGEYAEDEIVGAKFVKSIGGDIARIPLMEGKSTSDIVTRVQNAEGADKPNRPAWRDE